MQHKMSHGVSAVSISVCIATFCRPAGLERLLNSLAAQAGAPPFEVVIVDNDAAGSAGPVVRRFSGRLPLHYEVEPLPGLSRVRNRCVAASCGAFLAFIDDDEVAPARWLATLDRVRRSTRAAAVFGPVFIEFDARVPVGIRLCRLLRPQVAPECTELHWLQSRTSNAYVDRLALPANEPPFRADFDETGGEDVDLFGRMAMAGARFASGGADSAVTEFREWRRSNLTWVMRRSIRNGGNDAYRLWRGKSLASRLKLSVRCLAGGIADLLRAARNARGGEKQQAVEAFIDACEDFGRALTVFRYRLREYAR